MEGFGFKSSGGGSSSASQITLIKEQNKAAGFATIIPAQSRLMFIDIKKVSGTPTVQIQYTVGAEEIFPSTIITDAVSVDATRIISGATSISVAVSGGVVNVYFGYLSNYDI